MRMECDYLYGWIRKMVIFTKISPKMVNPRDMAWDAEEKEYRTCRSQAIVTHFKVTIAVVWM